MAKMMTEIRGQKIAYARYGEGEDAIVILHGWGCNKEMFAPIAEHLAAHCCVIVPDLCGFGESPEPAAPLSVEEHTDMILEFIASFGFRSVSLVGHSYGGRLILKAFSKKPLPFAVKRVLLVDAAGIRPKKSLWQHLSLAAYKCGRRVLETRPLKALFPNAADNWRRRRGSADYNAASPVMRQTLVLAVNEDLSHCLPQIDVPTLLFWGECDDATPLADAKKMEKSIPDAGLVVLPGGGHFSFLENTPYFLRVADAFFENN